MKISMKSKLTAAVVLSGILLCSCSAPAYKQNKYKSARRYRDCGCQMLPKHDKSMLSLNDR